jgi:lipopolysaccharide biosynthesis protein
MRRFLRVPGNRGPRVLEVNGSAVRVEGDDDLAAAGSVERVAILAHWASSVRLSRSVTTTVSALVGAGYRVVVVSTSEDPAALDWSTARPKGVTVIRRPNLGYDFGSWATALDRYPRIADADRVLLLNDSLAGPFAAIDHLLARFHASRADAWAVTDTSQFGYHLQSYFLGFPGRSLREPHLRRFWRDVRVEATKEDVIWRNEIGLSRLLRRERFASDVAIPFRRVVSEGTNPTILGWRRLLDRGFPFVKRELIQWPEIAPDGDQVRSEVRRRFDTDVDEWV